MGQWSSISSDTAFAVGNGTSATARNNLFELKDSGAGYLNGVDIAVISDSELTSLETALGL